MSWLLLLTTGALFVIFCFLVGLAALWGVFVFVCQWARGGGIFRLLAAAFSVAMCGFGVVVLIGLMVMTWLLYGFEAR
jgi:hypothetical protein